MEFSEDNSARGPGGYGEVPVAGEFVFEAELSLTAGGEAADAEPDIFAHPDTETFDAEAEAEANTLHETDLETELAGLTLETVLDMPVGEQETCVSELQGYVADGDLYSAKVRYESEEGPTQIVDVIGSKRTIPTDILQAEGIDYDTVEIMTSEPTDMEPYAVGVVAVRIVDCEVLPTESEAEAAPYATKAREIKVVGFTVEGAMQGGRPSVFMQAGSSLEVPYEASSEDGAVAESDKLEHDAPLLRPDEFEAIMRAMRTAMVAS